MLLEELADLDRQINNALLPETEARVLHENPEENIDELVKRRQLLLQEIARLPTVDPLEWQHALQRTEQLVAALANKQSVTKSQLKQINHGQRSVKLYNKFR